MLARRRRRGRPAARARQPRRRRRAAGRPGAARRGDLHRRPRAAVRRSARRSSPASSPARCRRCVPARADLNDALKEGGRSDGAVGLRTRRLLDRLRSRAVARAADGRRRDAPKPARAAPRRRRLRPAQRADDGGRRCRRRATRRRRSGRPFFDDALQRIRALPGVQRRGAIDDLPLAGGSVQPIVLEGRAELLPRDQPTVAGAEDHAAATCRRCASRCCAAATSPTATSRSMLVSRAAAKLLWGDADPIGRRVTLPLESRTQSCRR